jgi:hypothetical protein
MTENAKKILLFIKAPSHNLKSIEVFLGKRNFEVFSESDIKEALVKALELKPDFIFLAWDHPNPKIAQLPALIAQATLSTVVAYIMSNTKEASRKLNVCSVNLKLYPPISGPAIERLILKSEKNTATDEHKLIHKKTNTENQKNLAEVRKNLLDNLDSENVVIHNESSFIEAEKEKELTELIIRNKSIDEKNSILQRSAKVNLSPEIIKELKNSFQSKVKIPLEDLLENLAAANEIYEQENDASGIIIQKGAENPEDLGAVIQKGIGMGTSLGTAIQKNTSDSSDLGSAIQKGVASNKSLGLAIQDKPRSHTLAQRATAFVKAYCMSVYSDNWCGYLVIAINTQLDFSSIDLIFTDWINSHFNNLQEIDEYDFFEFKFVDQDFINQLGPKAEYHEHVKVKDYNLDVFFFPIDPNKMTLELNEEKNLIQLSTEEVPSDEDLNFSLHLHLPENKKYLLYTQANKSLSQDQKKRLIANRIFLLYTPLDFEKEYKKFMAEKNVKEIYNKLKKL